MYVMNRFGRTSNLQIDCIPSYMPNLCTLIKTAFKKGNQCI